MQQRETYILSFVLTGEKIGEHLSIKLRSVATGEQFVFRDMRELSEFLMQWQQDHAASPHREQT
ncbi:MAG: hypothetical protein IAF08_05310 [Rhizobacter sp.]|nr:hypothetical protein [Chlorobiales bacterium]